MKNITHTLKKPLKLLLLQLGLYRSVLKVKEILLAERKKYEGIKLFTATIKDREVYFSTEDSYSNSWFFPRYDGGKIHEKIVTEILLEALKEANCFVDIGANLGWYTCLAAKHMPQGIVYGFEMDELNFALLKKNVAINQCSNVELHQVAISDSPGIVRYQRKNNQPSPDFRLQSNVTDKNLVDYASVTSITLDDFFQSKEVVPDIVKIDVEGAEMKVLKGMRQILRISKPVLFLEIHPYHLPSFNTSSSAVLALLIENNYKIFEIKEMRNQDPGKQLKPLDQRSVLKKNTMLYATAIQ